MDLQNCNKSGRWHITMRATRLKLVQWFIYCRGAVPRWAPVPAFYLEEHQTNAFRTPRQLHGQGLGLVNQTRVAVAIDFEFASPLTFSAMWVRP
jgi:hypothetical protein